MPDLALDLAPSELDRIEQAEAMVRGYCGWHISPSQTDTVTIYPDASGVLMLPSLYVTVVTSVTEVGYPALDVTDYRFDTNGVLRRISPWYWYSTAPAVTVTFTHGYTQPPADVTAVVQALAIRAIGNATGLKSKAVGPFSETYSTEFLSLEKATLARYRIPPRT